MKRILTVLLLLLACLVLFVACDEGTASPTVPPAEQTTGAGEQPSVSNVQITYDANGGAFADGQSTVTQEVAVGSLLTAPASPTRSGYAFNGWALQSDGSVMWQFANDKPTAAVTLYATWIPRTATILSVEGATIDGTDILLITDSATDSVSLSSKVVCSEGCTWRLYYDRLGQTEIPTKIAASLTGALINGDNVFYIVATSFDGSQTNVYELTVHRSHPVSVNYYNGNTLLHTETVQTGALFEADYVPTIEGYTFNGWKNISGETVTEQIVWSSGLALYADTTVNTYTVTYDAAGGTVQALSTIVTYDATYSFAVPTRTGYTFTGWYYGQRQLTGSYGAGVDARWCIAENITATATWSINYQTVSLTRSDSNAGTVAGAGNYAFEQTVTLTATTNTGYTWLGWYQNGQLVTTDLTHTVTIGTQNLGFEARWTYYTVTTTQNDTEAGKVSTYNNTKVTVGEIVTLTATTNTGYTWLGWYQNGERVTADLTYSFTMGEENVAFEAKWTYYTVVANLIVLTDNDTETYYNKKVTVGETVTLEGDFGMLEIFGYTCLGWYRNGVLVSSNGTYSFVMGEENVNLEIRLAYYTVTTTQNDRSAGSIPTYQNTMVTVGQTVELSAVTNAGYTWLGWYSASGELVTTDLTYSFTMQAQDVCFEARWTYYTVTTTPNDANAGTTWPSNQKITVGETVSLTASTNLGYTWLGWYQGDTCISTNTEYSFTMSAESVSFEARWEVQAQMCNFTFTATPTTCTVSGIKDNTVTEITVPSFVTEISQGAFSGCSALQKITLPFVGATMDGTESFSYIFGDSVPSSLHSVAVIGGTTISRYAFYGCNSLLKIELPQTLKTINASAFEGCAKLISIAIPAGVKSIGNNAFYRCVSLIEVCNLSSLTTIQIGVANNHYLGYYAKNIYTATSGTSKLIADDDGFLFYKDSSACYLMGYTGTQKSLVLPDDFEYHIYKYAFYNRKELLAVTLSPTTLSIGEQAFYGCSGLTGITIPASVTAVESGAFGYCRRLVEIYNLSSLTIKPNDPDYAAFGYGFGDYAKIIHTNATAESKLSVDEHGFVFYTDGDECYLIQYLGNQSSLILPNSFAYAINAYAFYGCKDLIYIEIPSSVTSIGAGAFSDCANLERIVFYTNNITSIEQHTFSGCESLTSITIPGTVKSIGVSAFSGCKALTKISIPSAVIRIDAYAFSNCEQLSSVAFDSNNIWYAYESKELVNGTQIGISVTSDSRNVDYLTSQYVKYYWRRSSMITS